MRPFLSTLLVALCLSPAAQAEVSTETADIVDAVMDSASEDDAIVLAYALYYAGDAASEALDDEDGAALLSTLGTFVGFVETHTDIDPAKMEIPTSLDELTASTLLDAGYFLEEAGEYVAEDSDENWGLADHILEGYDGTNPKYLNFVKQLFEKAEKKKAEEEEEIKPSDTPVWDPDGDCPEDVDC